MKVYLLKEEDFERLYTMISRDPKHGQQGASSQVLSDLEQQAHERAYRFFNYQLRTWADSVKRDT